MHAPFWIPLTANELIQPSHHSPITTSTVLCWSLLFSSLLPLSQWSSLTICMPDREEGRHSQVVWLDRFSLLFMKSQQDNMQQGDKSQMAPEGVGPSSGSVTRGSQGSGLKRAFSESDHPSLIKMSQNARASMGVLGQGLKQLFQQQRKRLSLSRSTITSSSSSSSSSVVSACGTSPCAPEDASESCCPDSDIFSAPMVPSAAGQGSAAAGMMRRGTSLQSRRSKGSGSGSGSGDRDPLLKGSPQAPQRRYTHDPQQHISRPRSSSTTDTTPSSPAPGYSSGDALLSSGYQSTEETDRVSDRSH